MKDKLILLLTALLVSGSVWAVDDLNELPEPSTIALFASAGLAVILAKKFRQ